MTTVTITEQEPIDGGAYVELALSTGENIHISASDDIAQVTVSDPEEDEQASIILDRDGLHLRSA